MSEAAKQNDGGPAFPVGSDLGPASNIVDGGYGGMSLRDWFAGQALVGLSHGSDSHGYWKPENSDAWPRAGLAATAAYQIADAMLAEREKKTP